jgi:hypothetical protein
MCDEASKGIAAKFLSIGSTYLCMEGEFAGMCFPASLDKGGTYF